MINAWPRAHPAIGTTALLKSKPEDFQVFEIPAEPFCGSGEHLYLHLRKTGIGTPELAQALAAGYSVAPVAIGYAGMKDRRAVTEQWFSVHTPEDRPPPGIPGVQVLEQHRHERKLRRGDLAGNRFRVRLRQVAGADPLPRLLQIRAAGVPNYFGPQRFGHDNLERAVAWLGDRRRRRTSRFRQGLMLSVLRSFLFNEVLAARVAAGSWNRVLDGDAVMPLPAAGVAGTVPLSAGTPPVGAPAEGMAGTVPRPVPTGPLWGRGRSAAGGCAAALEAAALEPHRALCDGLEHAGATQARRSLVLEAPDLDWRWQGPDLELEFSLPPGSYATCLLAEVFELTTAREGFDDPV